LVSLKSPLLVPALQVGFGPKRGLAKRRLRRDRKIFSLEKYRTHPFAMGHARGKLQAVPGVRLEITK
jgi:hypothetical protein